MAEPTSWYAITSGWEVVDRSGARVGEVIGVVGDEDADIFEGQVALDADEQELDASPPGGAEISRDRDAEL